MDLNQTVTRAELAKVLGTSVQMLPNFANEGMPQVEKGKSGKVYTYDLCKCVQWYVRRQSGGNDASLETERLRKLSLEADIIQIQKDKLNDELVAVQDVMDVVVNEYATVRGKVLALPTKVTPELAIVETDIEIMDILNLAVRELLDELTLDTGKDADEFITAISKT